jgi:signal peptide peptidase SppA
MKLDLTNPLIAFLAQTGESLLALDMEQAALRVSRPAVAPEGSLTAAPGAGDGPRLISVIPVQGIVTPRGNGVAMDRLRNSIRSAANNPDVSVIVLDMDTPGGTYYGTPETGAAVAEAAKTKKVVAMVNNLAASAGYWIASQASEIVMSPSADVGSIGVYRMHIDVSKALADLGVNISLIHAGKFKVEGNPFQPLGEEALAYAQQSVDQSYDEFIKAVADGRGVSLAKVRDEFGQGRVIDADRAVALGMADRIATMPELLASLTPRRSAQRRSAMAFL